jgi:hypothetical protein
VPVFGRRPTAGGPRAAGVQYLSSAAGPDLVDGRRRAPEPAGACCDADCSDRVDAGIGRACATRWHRVRRPGAAADRRCIRFRSRSLLCDRAVPDLTLARRRRRACAHRLDDGRRADGRARGRQRYDRIRVSDRCDRLARAGTAHRALWRGDHGRVHPGAPAWVRSTTRPS